jgi:hemerythrin HHE cation binding domain-containing protein
MVTEVDILTPIHKGIRAMIYQLGARLQSTDFADPVAAAEIVRQVRHEFATASSTNCILCLLHEHAGTEERAAFPELVRFDPALIAQLIHQHSEIQRRLEGISRTADELLACASPDARREAGRLLNRQANQLFAFYLDHMNGEELTLVPLMKERLSDSEILRMRQAVEDAMSPERFREYMHWMLPALDLHELTGMFRGVKAGASPEEFEQFARLGEAEIDPARWQSLRARVGF